MLLSASISAAHDLSKALAHSRQGLANFRSRNNVAILMIGTLVAGNVDGWHGPAAGGVGFESSQPGLYQIPWNEAMAESGNDGSHTGTAAKPFVTEYVCPWIMATRWPAR